MVLNTPEKQALIKGTGLASLSPGELGGLAVKTSALEFKRLNQR